MDKTKLLFNIIAVLILIIVLTVYLTLTFTVPTVNSEVSFESMNINRINLVKVRLMWMIPVLCAAIVVSIVIAFVIEEWLSTNNLIRRIIEPQIIILSSIPSIVYGILAIYYLVFNPISSSYVSLAIIVILLVVPITTLSAQNAIRNIDISIRHAAYAVGATKSKVILDHVLPLSLLEILGGICHTISRTLAVAALCILVSILVESQISGQTIVNIIQNIRILLLLVLLFSLVSSFLKKNPNVMY